MKNSCPFCSIPADRIIQKNTTGFVIRDGFAVSPGHTLIIPHKHIGSFFELSRDERESLFELLESAKGEITNELEPDGYNIGINDGPAAGQTVPHLHIHLIPRFNGDQKDPRGGVRWIFPDKAKYWD
ncbi:HIT family protein [Undibacterium sp. Ji42W]|uniref:HIT family protein n=1 Tax=Undibacterium sp. Ji42W TaxID=3413039 RepID=UPI003BF1A7AD